MEYQKIANLLNDETNQPCKFRTRNWVEINDEARGTYSPNKQIKVKTSMLRSSLCDYSGAYIRVKGNINVLPQMIGNHSKEKLWHNYHKPHILHWKWFHYYNLDMYNTH